MSLDQFIDKFGGWTEEYKFYNGEVTLRYDPKAHVYLLVQGDDLVPQDGVTTICHIIDKSEALIPWGCKMMAAKLLANVLVSTLPATQERVIPQMTYADFEKLVLEAKNAHKEKLEEAATVGSAAHAWIEKVINVILIGDLDGLAALKNNLPADERAANCCRAAMKWMFKHNVVWCCTERKIYSRKWGYAGTMDGKAYVDSCDDPVCCPVFFRHRLSVIDWKSSNYLYQEYLYQTAAYQAADNEEFKEGIEDRWIIRLGKDDGEFEPWHAEGIENFDQDFDAFLTCLSLTRMVRSIKERLKEKSDVIKAEMKARAKKEREEALKIKCKYADKYKGTRTPKCNDGNPCQACIAKYAQVQQEREERFKKLCQ